MYKFLWNAEYPSCTRPHISNHLHSEISKTKRPGPPPVRESGEKNTVTFIYADRTSVFIFPGKINRRREFQFQCHKLDVVSRGRRGKIHVTKKGF